MNIVKASSLRSPPFSWGQAFVNKATAPYSVRTFSLLKKSQMAPFYQRVPSFISFPPLPQKRFLTTYSHPQHPLFLGEWKDGKREISVYRLRESPVLFATIRDEQGNSFPYTHDKIQCGILGTTSHLDFLRKIDRVAQDRIAVFVYPQEQPTELWIFEATSIAAPQIRQGREHLKQALNSERALLYEKALQHFETALKLERKLYGNIAELKEAISQMKKELFVLKCNKNSVLYLPQQEVKRLQETVKMYAHQDNLLECFETLLSAEENFSFQHHFLSAMLHEDKAELLLASTDYLRLSENNPQSIACIEKAYALFEQALRSGQNAALLLQKDHIRIAFESCLTRFNQISSQSQAPTCFVCFNVEEKDVGQWLEETLVPDLDLTGVKPIFCFRDLNQGQDLDNFQEQARSADLVIIVCTPELKAKYEERKKAPVGLAQEIRMIKGRYNEESKAHTIFPIYLKGNRKEALPNAYFEPIFGSKLASFSQRAISAEFNYFSNAFDLMAALRGISRDRSRELRKQFLEEVKKILLGSADKREVENWRIERKKKLKILKDSIIERVSTHTQMVNLPLPIKNFTGREKELAALHQACKHQHRVAVTGLGGLGKSALALQYANTYKSHYQFIHFMPAGTPQLILDGLLKLADDLHVTKAAKAEERLQWLKVMLGRFEREYLLIFDGVDQVEAFHEIEKHLPLRGRSLLLTSRMPEQSKIRGFEVIELNIFSIEEAVEYLLKATGSKEEKEAQELAEKLGRLPLALNHAAGYIRSRKISLQNYIEEFKKYQVELFEERYLTLSAEERTILKTWKISIEAIDHNCPLAKELLEFFAFLGQAPISQDLLVGWLKQTRNSDLELSNALRYLCDYSMVESPSFNHYSVHLLVQNVIKYQIPFQKQKDIFEQALAFVIFQMKQLEPGNVVTWGTAKFYMPHAMALLKEEKLMQTIDLEQQWRLTERLAVTYRFFGDPQQALELFQKNLSLVEKWNASSWFLVTSYNNYGFILHDIGRAAEALENYQKALEIQISLFGENDPLVAEIYILSGASLQALGRYPEALGCSQKALKIQKTLHHENHLGVASSYSSIGAALQALGRSAEALEIFQKALKIRTVFYNENHPLIAASYYSIGVALLSLGQSAEALEIFQIALKILVAVYDENHPEVAKSYSSIGEALQALGRSAEALEIFQKALKILVALYNENHPDVASSYSSIGAALQALGRSAEALEIFQKALKIQVALYNENHPDVASSYIEIAQAFRSLGRYAEALECSQKPLKIQNAFYNEDHPAIAKSYNSIGIALLELGQSAEALEMLQKALKILVALYNENHPDVAISYINIGEALRTLRRPAEALENLQKALKIKIAFYGEDHPSVATEYNNIGEVFRTLRRPAEALEMLQKVLKILVALYDENHPHVAISYINIGEVLRTLRRPAEALKYSQKALEILNALYDENHPDVATSYNNIGGALQELGRPAEALENLQKALKIRVALYNENHPDVATSYSHIGVALQELGRPDEALENFQKALKIQIVFYRANHPSVVTIHNNIRKALQALQALGRSAEAREILRKVLKIHIALYQSK